MSLLYCIGLHSMHVLYSLTPFVVYIEGLVYCFISNTAMDSLVYVSSISASQERDGKVEYLSSHSLNFNRASVPKWISLNFNPIGKYIKIFIVQSFDIISSFDV